MYCERCSKDFPEGLRYCKWCGGPLVDHPRITSELHSCPSCSAAIQPDWVFCKACGERLHTQRAASSENADTATQVASPAGDAQAEHCAACGESLDTGSLYCKSCGSAAYAEPPASSGGSALLCGACNNYSPIGSRACRLCGTAFNQGSRTVVEFPIGATTVQQKIPTLPDLDKQLSGQETANREQPEVDSGANTFIFSDGTSDSQALRKGNETNLLPGTAGAKSEQQAPTAIIDMGRITGPVDQGAAQVEGSSASGSLEGSPPPARSDAAPGISEELQTPKRTSESAKLDSQPAGNEPTTGGFGSEAPHPSAPLKSDAKTAIFVSPVQQPAAPVRQDSQDEIGTRAIGPPPRREVEATKEFQPAPPASASSGTLANSGSGALASSGQSANPPAWNNTATISPAPTAEAPPPQVITPAGVPGAQKKGKGVTIASAVVVVLIIGGALVAAWWFMFARVRPTPPPIAIDQPTTPPPVTPAPPDKPPAPVIPEGMIAVSAGTYTIGRDNADPLEGPQHKVDLPAFYIDRTEVTNASYKKFLDATGHKAPTNWIGPILPEGHEAFPVTGITWQDAADYAAWAGKRLPTEAEWEAAARGTDGRLYPWGNDFRSGVANIGLKPDKPTADQYPKDLKEAGRYAQGASPSGAVDMIGNAWEWVADEIKVYQGNTTSKLELDSGTTYRVIRGGAYDGGKVNDATYRGYLDGSQPYPKVGFRCAKNAK